MSLVFVYAVMAVAAGVLFPVQSAANAWVGRAVGGPVAATLISFTAGLTFLTLINAVAFRQWPSLATLAAQPPAMQGLGGALGATFPAPPRPSRLRSRGNCYRRWSSTKSPCSALRRVTFRPRGSAASRWF